MLWLVDQLDVDKCTPLATQTAVWWGRNSPASPEPAGDPGAGPDLPAFGNPSGDFQKKFIADRLKPLQEGKTMAGIAEDVIPELIAKGHP
ncbi:MAG: hypothetical protein CM1200mP18_21900 [Gammaproteobacteria bacterium]|nr:MAG: hypothetical protein CM1200mP18_21900 [Gammaproteobacteria bacterium]